MLAPLLLGLLFLAGAAYNTLGPTPDATEAIGGAAIGSVLLALSLVARHHARRGIRAIALALTLATTANRLPAQTVSLPSRSPLFVYQGGDTPNVNHHMVVPSQRYGIDFAVVGGRLQRELAPPDARRAEDFYCWDTPVLAPAGGQVVQATDAFPDNTLGVRDSVNVLGNHVVIRSGDRFLYLAHLKSGSVTVRAGSEVNAGDPIGRCGNSGNSDFPHIHLHATRSARFGEGMGLELTFGPMRVALSGKVFEEVEWPLLRGLWVRAR